MLPVYLLIVFTIGFTNGSPLTDEYFDTVLTTIILNPDIQNKSGVWPKLDLPNFYADFEEISKGFGKEGGFLRFWYGTAKGLNEPKRNESCYIPYYTPRGKTVRCNLTFENVLIEIGYVSLYVENKTDEFMLSARVQRINFSVEIAQNLPGKPLVTKLSFLFIADGDDVYLPSTRKQYDKDVIKGFNSGLKTTPLDKIGTSVTKMFQGAAELVPFPA